MSGADTDPTAAFEVVDDGTRVAILRELATHRAEHPADPHLPFSDLRERVGVTDSGRFNYHLDRLRGRFVEKSEAGYALTPAGGKLVAAVVTGAYEVGQRRGPEPIEGECFVCGEPLVFEYVEGVVTVTCENDHGFRDTTPPGALEDRSVPEVVGLASLVAQHEMELATDGVCPECYGTAESGIVAVGEIGELPADLGISHLFRATCQRCGHSVGNFVGGCVVRHPAVVALYHDHGIDVRERAFWELPFVAQDPTVESDDPLRLRIDVELGDDRLALTLDATASVVDVERSPTA